MEFKKKLTAGYILRNLDVIITGITLCCCVVLVNANVLMRYFFHAPITWSEEIVTSLFVWTVFIGSAYAHRKHSHLGVDVLVNLFPPKAREILQDVMSIVELIVLIMLTVISAQYAYHLVFSRTGEFKLVLTDLLRVPKVYTGIAVPIGFGLSTIYSVYFLLTDRLHILKPMKPLNGEEAETK